MPQLTSPPLTAAHRGPGSAGPVRARSNGTEVTDMNQSQAEPVPQPAAAGAVPQGVELRHLRYFVAVADAGTFTHAAELLFIAQPTLSQQIRRLGQIVGAALLDRRREGVRLTAARPPPLPAPP